ncbi:MAG: hypothetical protein IJX28_00405 [Clostridia bacterium]|nr:hypothetical protein [Clostridia bacterium]
MKIKAFFLVFLALCLISSATVSVFAADPVTSGSTSLQVSTEYITYPDFSLVVPSTIPIGDIQRTATSSIKSAAFSITLSNAKDLEGRFVEVAVSVPSGEFALYNGVYSLPYALYNQASGGTALKNGDIFTVFTEDREAKGRVEVDEMNIPAAGEYSGVLQFVVTVRSFS